MSNQQGLIPSQTRPGHVVDESWAREDAFHQSFLVQPDEVLDYCLKNSAANGLPDIAVSLLLGKHLNLQARAIGAKRILELGTLGGYSTIWLARALPEDGELITLEYSPKHAEVAAENIAHAGLSDKVQIIVGPAAESLAKMDPSQKFDFVFMDADKDGYPVYLDFCKTLVRKGGVIIIDNVVRQGRVSDPSFNDGPIKGIRTMLANLKGSSDFDATTVQTIGDKSYDGFTFALRL